MKEYVTASAEQFLLNICLYICEITTGVRKIVLLKKRLRNMKISSPCVLKGRSALAFVLCNTQR